MRPKSDEKQKNDYLVQTLAVFRVVRAVDADKFLREIDLSDIEKELHTTPEQSEESFYFSQKIISLWLDDSIARLDDAIAKLGDKEWKRNMDC